MEAAKVWSVWMPGNCDRLLVWQVRGGTGTEHSSRRNIAVHVGSHSLDNRCINLGREMLVTRFKTYLVMMPIQVVLGPVFVTLAQEPCNATHVGNREAVLASSVTLAFRCSSYIDQHQLDTSLKGFPLNSHSVLRQCTLQLLGWGLMWVRFWDRLTVRYHASTFWPCLSSNTQHVENS